MSFQESQSSRGWIKEVDWESIYREWGTPLYVYNESYIERRIATLREIFSDMNVDMFYAIKANSNISLMKIILNMGLGFECASLYEAILVVENVTGRSDRIMVNSCCLDEKHMDEIIRLGLKVNADSLTQLKYFLERGYKEIGIRVDPDVGGGHHIYTVTGGGLSKFGITLEELSNIKIEELSNLKRVHFHLGSGIDDAALYAQALEILWNRLLTLFPFPEIDIGGGFSYPYRSVDREFDFIKLREIISVFLDKFERVHKTTPKVILEPGRWIVAGSGVLMTKVIDIKTKRGDTFVLLDTGMQHLLRPALYRSYHEVIFPSYLSKTLTGRAYLAGNTCENSDIMPEIREVPTGLKIGDIALILDVGAYGYVMSSNYNSYPRPKELLITKSGKIIETYSFDRFISRLEGA